MVGGPAPPRDRSARGRGQPFLAATPSIVDRIFSVTASAMPLPFTPPAASTTVANRPATSRMRATYSTVPCPAAPRQPAARPQRRRVRAAHDPIAHLMPPRVVCDNATESPREAVTAKDGNCGESPPNACPHRHEHVAHGVRARARAASCATRSTRCASSTASRSRSSPSRRAATCAPRARCAAAIAGERFDVVHAHFGLTAWPALALRGAPHVVTLHGTDLRHPRSRRITRAALPLRRPRGGGQPRARARGARRRRAPAASRCCPAASTSTASQPIPRAEARERLSLAPDEPLPPLPGRPRAARSSASTARRQVAGDTRLLTLGRVHPFEVPLYVNAANAVLVPSAHEGFGLAVLEALACDVPVLATPVGVHPAALDGVAGTLCAPFDRAAWRAALEPHLRASDPRVEGRDRAALWSARQHGATRARRLGRGATVARRGAEFRCRFRMKGPLHAIRRRRSERPANGVDTDAGRAGGADRGAAHRGPVVASASGCLRPEPPTPRPTASTPVVEPARGQPRSPPARSRFPTARASASAAACAAACATCAASASSASATSAASSSTSTASARVNTRSSTASSRRWRASTASCARSSTRSTTAARSPSCASPASRSCPRCGALHGSDARFCPSCGTPVTARGAIAEVGEAVSLPERGRRGPPPHAPGTAAASGAAARPGAAAAAAAGARAAQPVGRAAPVGGGGHGGGADRAGGAARCGGARRCAHEQPPAAEQPAAAHRARRAARAGRAAAPSTPRRGEQPTEVMRPVDEQGPDTASSSAADGDAEAVAQPDRRAPRAVSVAPPGAPPAPGTVACPRCGASVGPEQDWCLECGAPARTRLVPTPNWRAPVAVLGGGDPARRRRPGDRLRRAHQRHGARRAGRLAGAAAVGHDGSAARRGAARPDHRPRPPADDRGPGTGSTERRRAPAAPTTGARAPRTGQSTSTGQSTTGQSDRAAPTPARRSRPASATSRPAKAAAAALSRDGAHQRPALRQPPRGLRRQRVQRSPAGAPAARRRRPPRASPPSTRPAPSRS